MNDLPEGADWRVCTVDLMATALGATGATAGIDEETSAAEGSLLSSSDEGVDVVGLLSLADGGRSAALCVVDSVLLPMLLSAPPPSGVRPCCDSSFTLLCTDLRRLGVVLGVGKGFDRLKNPTESNLIREKIRAITLGAQKSIIVMLDNLIWTNLAL